MQGWDAGSVHGLHEAAEARDEDTELLSEMSACEERVAKTDQHFLRFFCCPSGLIPFSYFLHFRLMNGINLLIHSINLLLMEFSFHQLYY